MQKKDCEYNFRTVGFLYGNISNKSLMDNQYVKRMS